MVDIFSLYKRKKEIVIEDDSGQKVKVLFVKINDKENYKVTEYYEEKLNEFIDELENNRKNEFDEHVKELTKKEIISLVVESQKSVVILNDDLSTDIFDEKGKEKPDKQVREEKEKAVQEWTKERTAELNKLPVKDLRDRYKALSIRSIALANAYRHWQLAALCYTCRKIDNEQKYVFSLNEKNSNYIGNADTKTLEQLISELDSFLIIKKDSDIREASESPDFTPTIESGKTSEGSPVSEESK